MSPRDPTTTLSLSRYGPEARAAVAGAQALADERQHAEVTPLHLLARLLERDAGAAEVFRRAGAPVAEVQQQLQRALAALPRSAESSYLSSAMLDLLERAERDADRERKREVGVAELLNALSQEIRGPAGEILRGAGVAPGSLRAHVGALDEVPRREARGAAPPLDALTRDLVEAARAGRLDPVIGRDAEVRRLLTILERRAKQHALLVGEPGVGRMALVFALARRLATGDVPTSLAGARLPMLDTGALIAGTRLRGEVEDRLKRLLASLEERRGEHVLVVRDLEELVDQGPGGGALGEVLEGALDRGDVRLLATTTPEGERRLAERHAGLLRGLTVLRLEEPSVELAIEIVRGVAGRLQEHHHVPLSEPAIQAAVRLAKRYVQSKSLPESALDLLDEAASAKRVETDGLGAEADALLSRVESLEAQVASLSALDDAASVKVREALTRELAELRPRARELRSTVEARRGSVAAVRALTAEVDAVRRQMAEARERRDFARLGELEHVTLPELVRRLERAEEDARRAGAPRAQALEEVDVATTLGARTGIPVAKMLEGEAEKLLHMERRLGDRVVGQADAVSAIARAVRRGRVGLRDPGRPIGSFLFLGPSGVGKTELAKALAEFLFDDEGALTRLDMSEFMERHMAQRLIGAPPGYADSEQGGFLTEAVRRKPYSVLLFDEVEKAHQDVFNLLLQVLDDGRLTDGRGRRADFSNTVVIMTSNIGSQRVLDASPHLFETAEGREALRDVIVDELRTFFRPELLNRIDETVVFRALSRDDLSRILDIQLRRLDRTLSDRGVALRLDDASRARLVDLGFEPALGARPLRRAIVRHVQDPLAEVLLSSGGAAPGTEVLVTPRGEGLALEVRRPPGGAPD